MQYPMEDRLNRQVRHVQYPSRFVSTATSSGRFCHDLIHGGGSNLDFHQRGSSSSRPILQRARFFDPFDQFHYSGIQYGAILRLHFFRHAKFSQCNRC
ncbi:hypothetical protein TNIN_184161 [Trichonephila inaurata madagascariensis]|uniref:Uncharacterized protein n=1 Tax=Trichonephila inaurata madagascariensis TaxID=2747483 RepID=A0A8X6KG29_9ARAC|nr:hypothetical protein TNIN_184161 [Trichonephila inaurata madagascariensis]